MNTTLGLFAATALVAVVEPGPTALLALDNGVRWGLPSAPPGIAGDMLSDVEMIGAVTTG